MSDLLPTRENDGHAPPLRCSRLLRWPDRSTQCPNEATWHAIWTADCENGLCCGQHMAEARRRWAFHAAHPYRMECSMPGAVFVGRENRCVVDEGLLGLTAPKIKAEMSQP